MARDRDAWLEDFSLVVTRDDLARLRHDLRFETFHASKPLSALWLTVLAGWAGALGALVVGGSWLLIPLWAAVAVGSWLLARRATNRRAGRFLAFVAGHALFWGVLVGVVAMWAAERSSAGWAYGIAGGFGFLLGVVHGNYEPDDLEHPEAISSIGYFTGPLGACLACAAQRHLLPDGLVGAAATGAIAGLVFLTPWLVAFLANLKNVAGLARHATLLLHRDETIPEAIALLDRALRQWPDDSDLLRRRALAYGLAGDPRADEEWNRLDGGSEVADTARGWIALRRGRPDDAAASFERAVAGSADDHWALRGLTAAHVRRGSGTEALAAVGRIPEQAHDALTLTYLAEAELAAGDPVSALESATTAIDEADSTTAGRGWFGRRRIEPSVSSTPPPRTTTRRCGLPTSKGSRSAPPKD